MTNIPLVTFFISVALYGAIAAAAYPKVKSLFSYYHTQKCRNGIVALVLGNLTLGTGLIYVAQYGAAQGVAAFLVPFGVLLGYAAMVLYTSAVSQQFEKNKKCKSYIDFIIYNGGAVGAVRLFLILQVIVFSLLCAFELSISSKLLSRLVGFGAEPAARMVVSLSILIVAIAYTWAGGLRATINTDWIQALFVIASLVSLLAIVGHAEFSQLEALSLDGMPELTLAGFLSIATGMYNAIITQFYNILNISVSTNYGTRNKIVVFSSTSVLVSVALCIFVAIGLLIGSGHGRLPVDEVIADLLNDLSRSDDSLSVMVASVIVAGFLALILSTLDATITVIQQLSWDVAAPGKTFSTEDNEADIRSARKFSVVAGAAIALFSAVLVLFFSDAEIQSIVLAMVWPLTFCTPIIALSAFYSARYNRTVLSRPRVRLALVGITVLVWGGVVFLSLIGKDASAAANAFSILAATTFWILESQSARLR